MSDEPSNAGHIRFVEIVASIGDEWGRAAGWKQRLARELRISPGHFSRILGGKRRPSDGLIQRAASVASASNAVISLPLATRRYMEIVYKLRRELRSMAAVAERLGVSGSYLSRLLSGDRRVVGTHAIREACERLGLHRSHFESAAEPDERPVIRGTAPEAAPHHDLEVCAITALSRLDGPAWERVRRWADARFARASGSVASAPGERFRQFVHEVGREENGKRGWKKATAERLDVSAEHLSRVLSGRRPPSPELMERAARAWAFSSDYFFGPSEPGSYHDYQDGDE